MDNLLSIVVIIVVALANFAVQRATVKRKNKKLGDGAGRAASGGKAESADQAGAEVHAQERSAERTRPADPGASAHSVRTADSAWTGNSSRQRVNRAEFFDVTETPQPPKQTARAVQERPAAQGGRAARWGAPIAQGGTPAQSGRSAQGGASAQGRTAVQGDASAQGRLAAQATASDLERPAVQGRPPAQRGRAAQRGTPPAPELLFAQPAHGGAVSRQTGRAAAAETVPVIPEKPAPRTRKTWETSAAETPKAADARVTAKAALRFGDISSENLARAVVWSEILGAPRAVRPFGRPNR